MITIKAIYYDGRSSTQLPVLVTFETSGVIVIEGETLRLTTHFNRTTIASRLGNTRRSLFLADGAKLETDDNDAVDSVCREFGQNPWQAILHRIEQRWLYALSAVVVGITLTWAAIAFGVPLAAFWAAKALPVGVEQQVGEQTLASLDNWLFTASEIGDAEQAQLQQRFSQIAATAPGPYRLLLRNSKKLGANAIALPGGLIIATDALVELAENDEQMLAVLAHEIGHVEYRHGIRSILQDSLTAILMIGLLGDASSISSLSATLPTVLVESRYSRQFEQEADRFALNLLREQGIDAEHFARILTLLNQSHHSDTEFDYLSSHPATNKRIEIIRSLESR
ncbi:MAG: M48 family metallopeptidase [Methylomonas sp.]|nr:M48 family metallopeptidase [Methylomonas sp.]